MKSKLILFLFVINGLVLQGQTYQKFLNDSLYWDVAYVEMGYICGGYGPVGPWRVFIDGDTVIKNISYAKFSRYNFISIFQQVNCPPFYVDTVSHPFTNFFMREDTLYSMKMSLRKITHK